MPFMAHRMRLGLSCGSCRTFIWVASDFVTRLAGLRFLPCVWSSPRIDWQTMKKQKGKPRLPLQGPNAICAFGLFRFCCPAPHSGIECSSGRTNGKATKNHEKCETDLQFPKTGVWYVQLPNGSSNHKQRRLEDDQPPITRHSRFVT